MSRQTGCIYKSKNGERWLARWRDTVISNGQTVRKMRFRDLAPVCDRYRTERDVQPLLDDILRPINAGTAKPESTLSVADYGKDCWLPWAEENCKPSTYHGYKRFWESYLSPRLKGVTLRDFRTVDAANLLADLHRSIGCGRTMLKHAKSILSGIFTLARNTGILDAPNPVQGTMIPKKAAGPGETYAASLDEVIAILDAVGKAENITRQTRLQIQTAVALTYFAGLRPGEARGVCWEDFDGRRLIVRHSVWHTHITAPKTEESVKPVPVIEPLTGILADLREAEGNPLSGPILRGPSGKPLNLENLRTRVLGPILEAAKLEWHGWYSLRRGVSTTLTSLSHDEGMASKGLLRHSSLSTTQRHYIKDVPENTLQAMNRLATLFNDCSTEVKQ
jgi:integrase